MTGNGRIAHHETWDGEARDSDTCSDNRYLVSKFFSFFVTKGNCSARPTLQALFQSEVRMQKNTMTFIWMDVSIEVQRGLQDGPENKAPQARISGRGHVTVQHELAIYTWCQMR